MRSFPKTCAALALSAALAGCAQADTAPVWQAVLPAGGAAVSIANCTVTESTALYTDAEGETTELPLLITEGAPLLCLPEDAALTVAFAAPEEGGGYTAYTESEPIEKADYVPGTAADGSLTYRFDTVYSFLVTVTTGEGSDALLLDCRR